MAFWAVGLWETMAKRKPLKPAIDQEQKFDDAEVLYSLNNTLVRMAGWARIDSTHTPRSLRRISEAIMEDLDSDFTTVGGERLYSEAEVILALQMVQGLLFIRLLPPESPLLNVPLGRMLREPMPSTRPAPPTLQEVM